MLLNRKSIVVMLIIFLLASSGALLKDNSIVLDIPNNQSTSLRESGLNVVTSCQFDANNEQHVSTFSGVDFVAENITFNNSYYKGTDFFHPSEWWYFDAVFENNYSVEFDIGLFATKYVGLVTPILNIYKNGEMVKREFKVLPFTKFSASKNHPFISLEGKRIMNGYVSASGDWIFNLSLHLGDYGVDLQFEGVTKGWKSKILNMWEWGVILPKANVQGILYLPDETVPVIGTGYMEHAWDGKIPSVWGWYWGKFVSKSFNIIWTEVIKNEYNEYIMLVLNQDNGSYYNIQVDDIQFSMLNYTNNDGWEIPTSFHFNVEDKSIKVDVQIDTLTLDHQISFGLFNYWRYHVLVKGTITYNGTTEHMENVQIMDLTRFR
jgi:hypothetical protein